MDLATARWLKHVLRSDIDAAFRGVGGMQGRGAVGAVGSEELQNTGLRNHALFGEANRSEEG
jgi:hypothetical protein